MQKPAKAQISILKYISKEFLCLSEDNIKAKEDEKISQNFDKANPLLYQTLQNDCLSMKEKIEKRNKFKAELKEGAGSEQQPHLNQAELHHHKQVQLRKNNKYTK